LNGFFPISGMADAEIRTGATTSDGGLVLAGSHMGIAPLGAQVTSRGGTDAFVLIVQTPW
jgi:hypothetical protein